jgi:hypothetical protein
MYFATVCGPGVALFSAVDWSQGFVNPGHDFAVGRIEAVFFAGHWQI